MDCFLARGLRKGDMAANFANFANFFELVNFLVEIASTYRFALYGGLYSLSPVVKAITMNKFGMK